MREQGIDTSFIPRVVSHKLGPVIFPWYGEVGPDRDRLRGIPLGVEAPTQD